MEEQNTNEKSSVIATIVTVFMLGYGLSYFGYFLRPRYLDWVASLGLDPGYEHAAMYLGHTVFLIVLFLCITILIIFGSRVPHT